MAATVVFKVTGNVEEKLLMLDTAVSPTALALFLGVAVDSYIRGRASDRFAQEGDDVTGPWKQLRPATIGYREFEGYPGPHPINVRSGELEEFITGNDGLVVTTQKGAYYKLPGNRPNGELGKKFETAQKGRKKPHTLPRPVLGMNQTDLGAVLTMLFHSIEGAVQ